MLLKKMVGFTVHENRVTRQKRRKECIYPVDILIFGEFSVQAGR